MPLASGSGMMWYNNGMGVLDDKIREPELRSFAKGSDDAGCRSVIVELNIPPVRFSAPLSTTEMPGLRKTFPSFEGPVDESKAMDELEESLRALGLARDVTRLNLAQAFVLEVSSDQLRSVADLPMVGAIRPNRTHRVSAK